MKNRWFWGRLLSSIGVLAAVLVLNFILFRIMPGDAVSTIIDPNFSPEAKDRLRELYGLDKPLPEQFFIYIKQMLTFSFGLSFLSRKPVWDELISRLPGTLFLMATSMFLSSVLGIWLGIKAALNRGKLAERIVLRAGAVTASFPGFFVQLVLIMLLARTFPIFPLRGS
ncbi:MAG: ABC transporter permease, partial [Synergistaceae bacterium]